MLFKIISGDIYTLQVNVLENTNFSSFFIKNYAV